MNDASPPESPGPETPLPVLSLWTRLLLLGVGWVLLLIGIAGLALPGIQGILTIVVAMAVLSVASQAVHRLTRRLLGRWPGLLRRLDHFREQVHRRLHRGDR